MDTAAGQRHPRRVHRLVLRRQRPHQRANRALLSRRDGPASERFVSRPALRPDFAVISPDDPDAMSKHLRECIDLGIPYAYDVSWQLARLLGRRDCRGVLGCRMLVVNDYEMGMITDKTGTARDRPAAGRQDCGGHPRRKRRHHLRRGRRHRFRRCCRARSWTPPAQAMPSAAACCAAWPRAGIGTLPGAWAPGGHLLPGSAGAAELCLYARRVCGALPPEL